jgi:phosphoserine phosphatase RsbU/P
MSAPTILIVDDEAVHRLPLSHRLRRLGYRTVEAADGANGFELARRHRPSLILLDLVMQRASGIDFLRAVRADATLCATPVVVITATSDERLLTAAARIGIQGCLFKTSYAIDDLSALVAALAGPVIAA